MTCAKHMKIEATPEVSCLQCAYELARNSALEEAAVEGDKIDHYMAHIVAAAIRAKKS